MHCTTAILHYANDLRTAARNWQSTRIDRFVPLLHSLLSSFHHRKKILFARPSLGPVLALVLRSCIYTWVSCRDNWKTATRSFTAAFSPQTMHPLLTVLQNRPFRPVEFIASPRRTEPGGTLASFVLSRFASGRWRRGLADRIRRKRERRASRSVGFGICNDVAQRRNALNVPGDGWT